MPTKQSKGEKVDLFTHSQSVVRLLFMKGCAIGLLSDGSRFGNLMVTEYCRGFDNLRSTNLVFSVAYLYAKLYIQLVYHQIT